MKSFLKKSNKEDTRFFLFIRELYDRYNNGVTETGAQLTYYLILSIFPFLIFLLNIIRLTPLSDINVLERLFSTLPVEAKKLLIDLIADIVSKSNYALLSLGALGGIWSASNGIMSVIKSINRAYGLAENRPYWKLRGLSIILTLGLALIMVISLGIIVFGEIVFKRVFMPYTWISYMIWKVLQILISILLIGLVLTMLYKISPSIKEGVEIRFQDALFGGIFSAIGLALSSFVFSYYVNNFGNYSNTYGSIGSIIVLLVWFYICNIVIVLGAEVNATIMFLKNKSIDI